jgi:hypothetical protein
VAAPFLGEAEHFQIYKDGEKALKGALMLLMMDELRAGDHLTVQQRQRT